MGACLTTCRGFEVTGPICKRCGGGNEAGQQWCVTVEGAMHHACAKAHYSKAWQHPALRDQAQPLARQPSGSYQHFYASPRRSPPSPGSVGGGTEPSLRGGRSYDSARGLALSPSQASGLGREPSVHGAGTPAGSREPSLHEARSYMAARGAGPPRFHSAALAREPSVHGGGSTLGSVRGAALHHALSAVGRAGGGGDASVHGGSTLGSVRGGAMLRAYSAASGLGSEFSATASEDWSVDSRMSRRTNSHPPPSARHGGHHHPSALSAAGHPKSRCFMGRSNTTDSSSSMGQEGGGGGCSPREGGSAPCPIPGGATPSRRLSRAGSTRLMGPTWAEEALPPPASSMEAWVDGYAIKAIMATGRGRRAGLRR